MKVAKTVTATLDDGQVIVIGDAPMLAIRYMLAPVAPSPITAIKFIRLTYGLSLPAAKDLVDALRNAPHLLD